MASAIFPNRGPTEETFEPKDLEIGSSILPEPNLEDNFEPALNVAWTFRKRTKIGGVTDSNLDDFSQSTKKLVESTNKLQTNSCHPFRRAAEMELNSNNQMDGIKLHNDSHTCSHDSSNSDISIKPLDSQRTQSVPAGNSKTPQL